MRCGLVVLAVVFGSLPSLAWGRGPEVQAGPELSAAASPAVPTPCKCSPRSGTIIRPYFPIPQPPVGGCRPGRGQLGCYNQKSTAGGVPLTVRNMIRTLD